MLRRPLLPFLRRHLPLACLGAMVVFLAPGAAADDAPTDPNFPWVDHFRQLEEILPTPNAYRTASGAPGHGYWQQRADYRIDVRLDEENHRLEGRETITYHNHSPDTLRYLWMQLDQNYFARGSDGALAAEAPDFEDVPYRKLRQLLTLETFEGGYTIATVTDADGEPLPHTIVKTMMRIDLPTPLAPGQSTVFSVEWSYNIPDALVYPSRGGYETFEADGNTIYEIAQWFPRMVAYTDVNGWHHKQFLGSGEFTLELGDYEVHITAPADHIVTATGVLQNPDQVLSGPQQRRLEEATTADEPVFIVTPEEARDNETFKSKKSKTWVFAAENVRDFAFASSRKFIWDAQGHPMSAEEGQPPVMAMSFYPNEAEPLWSRYSTHAIIHTLDVYSRYTFTYPYPVAISVNGPVGGMEYPMICFNGPRPYGDGTYWGATSESDLWRRSKYALISVIIHEVGHNFFPMIVNSDERQWTWMDEGLNTFLQFLTEQEWEDDYPSRRGEPQDIVGYMASSDVVPIMTNSESLLQFGNNAYAKPATALNILRESILGRELFDFAFREYARRWKFKRPMPADFFRTMEDASGVDLDWFWRGWFYTADPVDLGIGDITLYELDSRDPDVEKPELRDERDAEPETMSTERNRELPKRADFYPELKDFYSSYDELDVTEADRREFRELLETLEGDEGDLLRIERYFYVVELENHGGLVMPVILQVDYADGTQEILRIPAEIWRKHPRRVRKLLMTQQEIVALEIDPRLETADIDRSNNHWPHQPTKTRFQLFKETFDDNPMLQDRNGLGRVDD